MIEVALLLARVLVPEHQDVPRREGRVPLFTEQIVAAGQRGLHAVRHGDERGPGVPVRARRHRNGITRCRRRLEQSVGEAPAVCVAEDVLRSTRRRRETAPAQGLGERRQQVRQAELAARLPHHGGPRRRPAAVGALQSLERRLVAGREDRVERELEVAQRALRRVRGDAAVCRADRVRPLQFEGMRLVLRGDVDEDGEAEAGCGRADGDPEHGCC